MKVFWSVWMVSLCTIIPLICGNHFRLTTYKEPKPVSGSRDGIGINRRTHWHPGDNHDRLQRTLPSRPEPMWGQPLLKPQFDNSSSSRVVAAAGRTAFLHCIVNHLGNRVVTWTRHSEGDQVQVLTAGLYTYTTDERYSAVHPEASQHWSLRLASSRVSDSGNFECQVSTEPKISRVFELQVVDANAKIRGPKEVHMKSGSHINLTCAVSGSTEPPQYIYWYRGATLINYSARGGISVVTDKLSRTSRLVVTRATTEDSGNYSCVPASAEPASVNVYILNGEHPAAVQGGQSTRVHCPSLLTLMMLFGSVLSVLPYR